jgi:von Willebrand factor type D domain
MGPWSAGRRARPLAILVALLVLVGWMAGPSASSRASASVSAVRADSPATSCASRAPGPVTDDFKLAVCSDLVEDLAGIGKLLGLPVLAPTGLAATTPVRVVFSPSPNGSAYMETNYFHPPGPLIDFAPCQVTVYPSGYQGESQSGISVSARIHVLLVHEAVHCYQNSVITFEEAGGNASMKVPQWMSEGLATYVATLYTGYAEPATEEFWDNGWLGTPNKELQARSYDAVGWYSLVARVTGNDLISKIVPAWQAWITGGEPAYLDTLGGNDPAVAPAWAPSLLHAPQWGDAWDTPGVGVPTNAQPTELHDTIASEDVPYQVQIAPYGAIVDSESTVSDGLVEISIDNGFASVHDNGTTDVRGFTDQVFCLKDACDKAAPVCPGGPTPDTPIPLTVPFVVAAGGSSQLGTVTMENISVPGGTSSLEDEVTASADSCKPSPTKPKTAFSEGDPHIQALNGGTYDFQGAGEFTLVRSESGDVDIQARARPAEGSTDVAWNSAIAMRVVSSKVEIDVGEPPVVLVNGRRITLPKQARPLSGGGQLTYTSNGVTGDVVVTWPDGSQVDVFSDKLAENATFTPPPAGVDIFSGLFAAFVPKDKPTNSPSSRPETLLGGDGRRYVINPATRAGFKLLNGPFADSWRITPKISLFTYRKGKSTRSYDLKGFPTRFPTIPAGAKTKAEATCKAAGVSDPKLLADCELDVGETGQAALATATARVEASSGPTPSPPSSGGGATDLAPPSAGGVHPLNYYFTHPCDALTSAEINQALGFAYPEYKTTDSTCPIGSLPGDQLVFTHQSAKQFESENQGSVGSGPVPSLGHDAYCIVKPIAALDQSYVVVSLGDAGSLQILADDCTDGTALATDVLAHISGLS